MPYKIVRICEEFPPLMGGLSSGMLDLASAQHKLGHNINIIARSHHESSNVDSKLPFNVIRIQSGRNVTFGLKAYYNIKKLVKRPDIIHTHGPAAISYLLSRKKEDPPLVHTMHSVRKYQYELYRMTLQKTKHKAYPSPIQYSCISPFILREYLMESFICRKADHILTVAKFFIEELNKHYNLSNQNATTVYNGTNLYRSSFGLKEDKDSLLKSENIKILYVGRFDWHKRIDLLIHAMPMVVRDFPKSKLVLVGGGKMKDYLKDLSRKLNLSSHINFMGWVGREEIAKLYNSANCFCIPSISEGLPKVVLEAMGCGIPIISSDNAATREILHNGKNGFLIKDPSPEAWTKSIKRVLTGRRDINEKIKSGIAMINKTYRWEHVAKRIDSAYDKVLKRISTNGWPQK